MKFWRIVGMNYKKMYFGLFNENSKALEAMEQANYGQAADILKQAQIDGEEAYMDGEE